jgi:hypothetical protein
MRQALLIVERVMNDTASLMTIIMFAVWLITMIA